MIVYSKRVLMVLLREPLLFHLNQVMLVESPTNSNYYDTEIWIEVTTAFVTGTAWQVQVTYTNQSGVTGRTSIISSAQAGSIFNTW